MEQPYSGRAVIDDNFGTVTITIPTEKQWGAIIFLCFWLCGWCAGMFFGSGMLFGHTFPGSSGFPSLFILVWFVFWTFGGIQAIRAVVWQLAGREIITAGQGALTITRKYAMFNKPRTYDLASVQQLRVFDERTNDFSFFRQRNNNLLRPDWGGVIRFDYGMKTVKFAAGIDEAEASHILQLLKEKGILTQYNLL